jgi:hypothetical protein
MHTTDDADRDPQPEGCRRRRPGFVGRDTSGLDAAEFFRRYLSGRRAIGSAETAEPAAQRRAPGQETDEGPAVRSGESRLRPEPPYAAEAEADARLPLDDEAPEDEAPEDECTVPLLAFGERLRQAGILGQPPAWLSCLSEEDREACIRELAAAVDAAERIGVLARWRATVLAIADDARKHAGYWDCRPVPVERPQMNECRDGGGARRPPALAGGGGRSGCATRCGLRGGDVPVGGRRDG